MHLHVFQGFDIMLESIFIGCLLIFLVLLFVFAIHEFFTRCVDKYKNEIHYYDDEDYPES